MPKKIICAVLALIAALCLCGCSSIYEDEYYYTEDYSEDSAGFELNGTMIRNYASLRGAVAKLINSHGDHARFIFSNYSGNLNEDLAAVCYEVQSTTPIGAFAVEMLRYETSRVVSYYAADIYVTYSRSAEEIEAIRSITDEDTLRQLIEAAIIDCSETMLFKYYSTKADATVVKDMIEAICEKSPLLMVSQPRVEVHAYPEKGSNSIYEVSLKYDHTRSQINAMRSVLRSEALEIAGRFTQENSWERAVECAEHLSFSCELNYSTDENSAYNALVRDTANCEGIARAYAAICGLMDIECYVIRGSRGIGSTEPHYWNIVKLDGDYYHFDVSAISEFGMTQCVLRNDGDIWGKYMWDPDSYPACSGPLNYAALYAPTDKVEEQLNATE